MLKSTERQRAHEVFLADLQLEYGGIHQSRSSLWKYIDNDMQVLTAIVFASGNGQLSATINEAEAHMLKIGWPNVSVHGRRREQQHLIELSISVDEPRADLCPDDSGAPDGWPGAVISRYGLASSPSPKEEFDARGKVIVKAIKSEWENPDPTEHMLLHVAGSDGFLIESILNVLVAMDGILPVRCNQLKLLDERGTLLLTGQAAILANRNQIGSRLEPIGERGDRLLLQFTETMIAQAVNARGMSERP